MNDMNGKTLDIVEQNCTKLKELFPEICTEGKIDFDALREVLGDYIDDRDERYSFTWNGKSKAKMIAQTPSTGTLRPCPEESVDWEKTQNIFIEGDNLEVLKLLQKSYYKKIKMIYIDPPYNTGKDFVYKDDFRDNIKNYKQITGQLDGKGKNITNNPETSGRYHTDWLNMMYPRLKVAKNLLRNDGLIFISIDDNEVSNLRKICDEIFGEENFIGNIIWEKRYGRSNNAKLMTTSTEHILFFRKSPSVNILRETRLDMHQSGYSNPDNDPRGLWTSVSFVNQVTREARPNLTYTIENPNTGEKIDHPTNAWKVSWEKYIAFSKENRLYWGADGKSKYPRIKRFLSELDDGLVPINFWKFKEAGTVDTGTKEIKELMKIDAFTFPKPTLLIKKMFSLFNPLEPKKNHNEIYLDFFAGSATTAHAVLKQNLEDKSNRKFITIQLPEACDKNSEALKAGYKTIAEIGKERIRRAGKKIKEENPDYDGDLGFKVFKLDSTNLKPWEAQGDLNEKTLEDYIDNIKPDRSEADVLYEILLKYGLDLTLPIKEHNLAGQKVYDIGLGALLVCLSDQITPELADEIVKLHKELKPDIVRVVLSDKGFKNDVDKANVVQILKQADIKNIRSL